MAAMAIDGLIDGMDLDEQWCMQHVTGLSPAITEYLLSRVRGKLRRIDYYQDNTVTCIIADEDERWRLLKVPGRDIAPHLSTGLRLSGIWSQIIAFLHQQKHNLPYSL